jgi:hypothetical protein
VPIVLKFGSLNLLETLGPVQPCTGIALYLLFYTDKHFILFTVGQREVEWNTSMSRARKVWSAVIPLIHETFFSSLIIRQGKKKLPNEEFYNLHSSTNIIK